MYDALRKKWNEQPLVVIIFLAAFFRLFSVLFSKGYGMFDDHFLVIESAQSWVDNFDYDDWLPSSGSASPPNYSLFYPGIHYLLFKTLQWAGIYDPQIKMFIVRFFHALLSMLTVISGYRISEHLSGKKAARTIGLLLSIYWFIPCLSVRNLVEVACIPFLIYSTWLLIKPSSKKNTAVLIAGLVAGLAFSIRFQCILFIGGMGLALLAEKKWKDALLFGFGALVCMALIQGIIDYAVWKKPFVEAAGYIRYNITHANDFLTRPWYLYFIFLAGILIPPISLFLFFGYFRSWKKHLLLFLPSFIFLAFHSYFPNKQERFILPVIPFIIVSGISGWNEFESQSGFWAGRKKLLSACWIFFWVLNLTVLPVISVTYTKRSYVEAMSYLSTKKDYRRLIVEDSDQDDFTMPPFFYLGKWYREGYIQGVTKKVSIDSICRLVKKNPRLMPNYVLFYDDENLERRIENFKKCFPRIQYETTVEPGFTDKLLHRLNPVNRNSVVTIYKIEN